jgi:hypothetical protein
MIKRRRNVTRKVQRYRDDELQQATDGRYGF